MKILVTGGAGFIGSCLIERLIKNPENEVVSLDNYFTGKKTNHIPGVLYIEGNTKSISELVQFKPDIVYHFGEYSRVSTSFKDEVTVWDSNIVGTKHVLEFCKKNNAKLIYSASSTKFGDLGENKNKSPYAFYKSINTELINNYSDWFGLDYAICYFYNVYGSRQISNGKYATVIGIFQEQYTSQTPLTVTTPGTQKRDFTHVSDIVNGLVLLSGGHASGDGYCFGTGKSRSILEVAKMFSNNIELIPSRMGERKDTSIDLEKARLLGWVHKIDLEDYIGDFKNEK